jgi:cytochrome oxidase Cu insertion factor (SCO1/SenC/PrrC family)
MRTAEIRPAGARLVDGQPKRNASMKKKLLIAFAALAGLAAVGAVYVAPHLGSDYVPPDLANRVVGQPAPNFTLADASGRSVSLADFRGRTVVL